MGRFLTPDRTTASNAAVLPGNWNKYAYVGRDPVNKTDPLGFCSVDDHPRRRPVSGIYNMKTNAEEQELGRLVCFLLPSLKLKDRGRDEVTIEEKVHRFLVERFGGYTAAAGNIFGYWKDRSGRDSYGEHREFRVSMIDEAHLPELKRFLAETARDMHEECIWLQQGQETRLIYAAAPEK